MKTLKIQKGKSEIIFAKSIESSKIILDDGANLVYVLIADEQKTGRALIEFDLGKRSEVKFYGFIIGKNREAFNFETVARHTAPGSKSNFNLRSAMFDRSSLDYKGNLNIEKDAQQSDAYLATRTLLMSENSRVNAIPALEILADDVKAGHAATIGKIDDESLFYLQCRGLAKADAEKVMLEAFFGAQVNMLADENVRDSLKKLLLKLMPAHV
jgi:Fe-S cluster assembly protein SufD